jgi:hypothetical protein
MLDGTVAKEAEPTMSARLANKRTELTPRAVMVRTLVLVQERRVGAR